MKNLRIKKCLLFSFLFFLFNAHAQEGVIHLNNSSFEDFPRPGWSPRGWNNCGDISFPNETPPDIHPSSDAPFGVTQSAYDGDTYLGMVVRENDSWESIAQRLQTPLLENQCYSFSIYLATSADYKSIIRVSYKEVEFKKPIKLRIWGGDSFCGRKQLLAESPLITHHDWKEYQFNFSPKRTCNYIVFEAFFKTPTIMPPNGNILLDNASALVPINCETEVTLEVEDGNQAKWTKVEKIKMDIKTAANSIEFGKKGLTEKGRVGAIKVAWLMKLLPDYELVIDFSGLKKKETSKRLSKLNAIFKKEKLPSKNYQFKKSKKREEGLNWLLEKEFFYLRLEKIE